MQRVYNKACRMLKIQSQMIFMDDMNPIESWYISNEELRGFFRQYYLENRKSVNNRQLYDDMKKMMKSGKGYDAMLVVNLLAIFKIYFADISEGRCVCSLETCKDNIQN